MSYLNKVFFGDARNMKELPDNSVHLIVTSPPYFNVKDYSLDGHQKNIKGKKEKGQIGDISDYKKYINEMLLVWKECHRVLKPNVKLIIFTPLTHTDIVRETLGNAGAGKIGNYDFCSFSTRGTGRYRGNENSNPSIGESLRYEAVEEERIEVIVPRIILKEVIETVRKVHPYEEMAFDIYSLEDYE